MGFFADSSGSAPTSQVTLYNKSTGETTNAITLPDRVAEKVYVTSKLIFVSGSGMLSAYTYTGEQAYEIPVYGFGPAAAAVEPLRFSSVYKPRPASSHIETALVFQATESSSTSDFRDYRFTLPMNVIALAISPSQAFAFTADTMYVYSFDGNLQRSQNLGTTIMSVKQVCNDYVILWGEDSNTYILQLR